MSGTLTLMDQVALELAARTLAEAITSLGDSGSLRPLIVVQRKGQRTTEHLPPVPPEQAAMAARIYASARDDSDAAAFATTGVIEEDGVRHDAIIVEAWHFAPSAGIRIGVRYEVPEDGVPRTVGSTMHLGAASWFEAEHSAAASVGFDALASTPLGTHVLLLALNELMMHGSPITPFALVQKASVRERVDMTGDRAEAAASVQTYALTRTDADFVGYARDGHVPLEGKRTDALVIDVWHFATALSFRVAQPYMFRAGRKEPAVHGRSLTQLNDGSWVPSGRMELGGEILFGS